MGTGTGFSLKNHGLGKEVEGNVMRIAPVETLPLQTRIYFLKYAKAEDMALVIAKKLSPRGSLIAYPPLNAVTVTDALLPLKLP
jgi:hypothetical protein